MSIIHQHRISLPEPPRKNLPLEPVFLPFAGCGQRCIFCDQHSQTGQQDASLMAIFTQLKKRLQACRAPFGLGFFGGTFTRLPKQWQEQFLELAAYFRAAGQLVHVRLSTRPDCVLPGDLHTLKDFGVDMVELGVQSFSDDVLGASQRGYSAAQARAGCEAVQNAGLGLGIQLLPGLPEHGLLQWTYDLQQALALQPDCVRIYPCVVMRNTELARRYQEGLYTPWSLDEAVERLAEGVLAFWRQQIPVIRLGLAGQPELLQALVAGPWHPAFGNMVRSQALFQLLRQERARLVGRLVELKVPRRLQGELWGYQKSLAGSLKDLGIIPERVAYDQDAFCVFCMEEEA